MMKLLRARCGPAGGEIYTEEDAAAEYETLKQEREEAQARRKEAGHIAAVH